LIFNAKKSQLFSPILKDFAETFSQQRNPKEKPKKLLDLGWFACKYIAPMEHGNFTVKKRNGETEIFSAEKVEQVVKWATEGVSSVSANTVCANAKLQLFDGISTKEIHQSVIDSAVGMISEKTPNYQYVAGRLVNYQLRKEVWGGKNPPKLIDFIKKNVAAGVYENAVLELYTESEINKLDDYIKHSRDDIFTYAGIQQLCDKYLVQNRKTGEIFETPQFAYMLVAMTLFSAYDSKTRIARVKKAYDAYSKHKSNLPTPLMAGVRTKLRQYSSCCLIDIGDSIESIFAANTAVGFATSQRFGIGLNAGEMRAIGSEIRKGDVIHTGVIPFLKVFESTVKSCHQNGIRGGGATVNFPFWHYEIEDILQLKNNAGTDDNRVRKLDYVIQFSKVFYERFLSGGNITLFSPHEVGDLYEKFGTPEFDSLYEKYEKSTKLKRKKVIPAAQLMSLFTKESVETGRIYFANIDHTNERGAWLDTVRMNNLCMEVCQPVKPLKNINDPDGEIGICVLSAINVLEINSDAEMEDICDITVRMLDELIDYQDYFAPAAENFAKKRRSLAVGITNFAAYLAKNGVKYEDPEAPNVADELMEKIQYFLLKASCQLAKEKGPCEKFDRTKYSLGILPIDTYKKDVDSVVTRKPSMDWESLRAEIKEFGLRNSTVSALMPCESSSVIQSSTNGIEPVRSLVTYKESKSRQLPVIVPNIHQWKNKYTLAFDMKDNIGMINIVAALQKWVDMSISANRYYNYAHYEGGALPDSKVIREFLYAYKMGWRTGYYLNTNDGDKQSAANQEESCSSGACSL